MQTVGLNFREFKVHILIQFPPFFYILPHIIFNPKVCFDLFISSSSLLASNIPHFFGKYMRGKEIPRQ